MGKGGGGLSKRGSERLQASGINSKTFEAAGFDRSLWTPLAQALAESPDMAGGGALSEMMEKMISMDDSAQAQKILTFLEKNTSKVLGKEHHLEGAMKNIRDAKSRFVTGSTGETLRAANLLQQLSGSQTGLK
jgi:hypothetical protein